MATENSTKTYQQTPNNFISCDGADSHGAEDCELASDAKTELQTVIESACKLAYAEDADHVVGRIAGVWRIAHIEDGDRINSMTEPKFRVNSRGVDQGHIDRGEITENWELPTVTREGDHHD